MYFSACSGCRARPDGPRVELCPQGRRALHLLADAGPDHSRLRPVRSAGPQVCRDRARLWVRMSCLVPLEGKDWWFGHVKRGGEDTVLGVVERLEVEGRRPVGRPRKMWRRCVQEDLALVGLDEHRTEDRVEWRRAIKYPTAQEE